MTHAPDPRGFVISNPRYRRGMFLRTIGTLGLVALTGIGLVVILTALVIIAAIAFPGLAPDFSN